MKKIFISLTSIMLLAGCAETIALLGPASSALGGGNVIHSSISSAASYGVKKTTGKSPMQHVLTYAEEKNPDKNKDRCLSFVKETESEACYVAKKQIAYIKKSASKKLLNVLGSSKTEAKFSSISSLPEENKKTQAKEDQLTLKVKTKKELQLRSVESILVESVMSKEQISHLRVSIKKSSKINNSSK